MAVALFWVGAPYLIMSFSTQYWMLLGCAALVGIGNKLWHPTAIPLLARRFPERRGLVVSIHGMGGNVGDAVAPLVVGAMLSILSWRNVMVLNVIPGVLMACVILLSLGRMQSIGRRARACASWRAADRPRSADRRPADPARQPHADDAVDQFRVPLDDAEHSADLPAALPGARDRSVP